MTFDGAARSAEDRRLALGRGVERLIQLASQDPVLADGLAALVETAAFVLAEHQPIVPVAADAEQEAPLLDDAPGFDGTLDQTPTVVAADVPVVPETVENPDAIPVAAPDILAVIDSVMAQLESERAAQRTATQHDDPFARAQAQDAPADGEERDLPLAGIATRARLRADLTRAVAERARTGTEVDDGLVHRARSEGAAVWMLDLVNPDPDALERFAECLDAVGDAAELVVLLRRYEPANVERRSDAIRAVAAVQSSLRLAAGALRRTDDEDQLAVFAWLRGVTEAERVYVPRHMKLADPLDPALLPEVVAPIREELAVLVERAERQEIRQKRAKQLKYLAGQLASGKATSQQTAKLVDTVMDLVDAGTPPTSLLFRELLFPVAHLLPPADGTNLAYGRVLAAISEHGDRAAAPLPADETPDDDERLGWAPGPIASPRDAARLAGEHLGRVAIPESAVEHIDEFDSAPNAVAWGRSFWRALRALHTYAEEAGWEGDFWDWCANSGHQFAWPATPKKLAMRESQTAMTQYREDRRFEVDLRVSDEGRILMEAHCKIAEGGGALSPRLYFHDDTDGPTGLIHVGFMGPHKHVRNASTN